MGETDERPRSSRVAASKSPATPSRRALCYAHRGARAYLPENTVPAFALAFELGADGIECDVQRTSDGRLVIIHDGTVNRTTDGTGPVAGYTFAALRQLDAGRARHIPATIPTLEETLDLVRGRAGLLNLEIKGESVDESVGTARAVEPLLRDLDDEMRARLLVSSFEHPAIAWLKDQLPWLRTGALYGEREWRGRDLIAPAISLRAEAIHPALSLVTPELVRRAHETGLQVNVWTVNLDATIRRLMRLGVDGIFSDYPERVVIVRARLAAFADARAVAGH